VNRFIVLTPEKHAEKQRLLIDAFGTWNRQDFNNFIKSTAKNGRTAYEKISKDVRRPIDEIKRYAETFWAKGAFVFPPAEWDRHVKQIEKGEKKLEEIQRLTSATKKLIMMFTDPWEQLTFRHVGNQG
jgi:SWI/SNF-related matrix-associated actin-dependent regulator of chromatin subfamily A member 5